MLLCSLLVLVSLVCRPRSGHTASLVLQHVGFFIVCTKCFHVATSIASLARFRWPLAISCVVRVDCCKGRRSCRALPSMLRTAIHSIFGLELCIALTVTVMLAVEQSIWQNPALIMYWHIQH